MAGRDRERALARIATIRQLQQRRAATEAAEAKLAFQEAQDRCAAADERLEAGQREWNELVARPRLDLGLVGLRGRVIVSHEAELERLRAEERDADGAVRGRAEALKNATVNADIVRSLARDARRARQDDDEERVLAEAEDRLAGKADR